MSQIEAWLQQWHDIVGPDYAFSEPDQLRGVLNDARWADQTLEALFAPIPHGDAVLARVRECTSCQAPDDRRPYVTPKALPATDAELIALAKDALARNKACGFTDDEGPIATSALPHLGHHPELASVLRRLLALISDITRS